MGVRVIKRGYNERYTDGETDWLLGNVCDWQKAKFTVEVSVEFNATEREPVSIDTLNNIFEISSGKNWGDFGFDIGMSITFSYTIEEDTTGDGNLNDTNSVSENYEIVNIFGSKMVVDKTIDTDDFTTIPLNFGRKKISEVRFFAQQEPEGCKLQYQHLTNADKDNPNLTSFIDATTTEFVVPNIKDEPEGTWKTMEAVGFQSGMSVRQARVRKLTGSSEDEVFATWNLQPTTSGGNTLVGYGIIFQNRTIQSLLVGLDFNPDTPQGYRSQTGVNIDRYFPQGVSDYDPDSINPQQPFISNIQVSQSYTQQFFFNLTARITETENIVQGDGGAFQFVILKFINGTNYDFAGRTVLRRFEDVSQLVNQNLNFNGVIELTIENGQTYSLCVEYVKDLNDISGKGLTYVIEQGVFVASNPNESISTGSTKIYEFEVQYMISSLFDSVNNFEDLQNLSPPSYLLGEGSLTDNFKFQFYPEWNNPNVIIQNELSETVRLGNTGWFNENFNQLNNDFKVDSINYFDESGNNVDSLDYFSKTKIVAVISGVPNLDASTECGFGFSWIPINENDYREKKTSFYQNLYIQSGDLEDGFSLDTLYTGPYTGAGINGASMDVENIKFTKSGNKIIFEGVFVPNVAFYNEFEQKDSDDRNYIIYFSVADGQLERNFSDRVTLLGDYKNMIKTIPPAGEYPYISNTFIEHPDGENASGTETLKAITQDDILCRMPFRINKSEDISFNSITFGVEVFNISTGKSFILDSYNVDVSQSVTDSSGIQQFSVDERRNFILDATNNKNWVKIEKNDSLDTVDFAGFIAFFAFRIRWEDWLVNSDAPSDFFDSDKLNNGRNNDWYDYITNLGWQINFITLINASVEGENVLYKNQWKFDFVDYDQNENIEVVHNYYRNSDNTLINVGIDQSTGRPLGVILNNEQTRIEISFRILDSGVFDPNDVYSQITIEIDSGAGVSSMRMLSSAWDSESNNPLKPINGGKRLTFEVDPTNKILTASCLVDPDLLQEGSRYRITGRVGCGKGEDSGFKAGLYEFRYENKYE